MGLLQLQAALAGLFFGIWPLLMNRSGLGGVTSALVFASGVAILILPLAASLGMTLRANWGMVLGACAAGAIGMVCFNGMLAKASKEQVGMLFLTMIVVQITIPAFQHFIVNGSLTGAQGWGIVFALLAAVLLSR